MCRKLGVFFGVLVFLLCGELAALKSFAQCGTYFKTLSRGVNKLNYANTTGGPFRLDDWTGDGRLDFWDFQPNSSTANILIYPGKATGYWDWDNPIVYTTALPNNTTTLGLLYVKDFNGDGSRDLFYEDHIYRNNGNGTLTTLAQITTVQTPLARIGFYDLNGDNRLDILDEVNASGQGHAIVYYLQNADGSYGSAVTIFAGTELLNPTRKVVGDFNGDGLPDVVYGTAGNYRIFLNQGSGNFSVGSLTAAANGTTGFIDTRDFNGDGRADIVALGGTPRKIVIFYGQTNGTFTETAQAVGTQTGGNSQLVELNGDTKPDVIEYGETFYNTYINDGAGGFTVATYQRTLGNYQSNFIGNILFADLTGDGKADIYDTSNTTYNLFGEFVVFVRENVCPAFGETRRPNFNGDMMPDLVTWNPSTGNWRIGTLNWLQNTPTGVLSFNWGTSGDVAAPGDYDGDFKTDYAVYRGSEGNWYVYLSSSASWYVRRFGLAGDIAVPGDYDGGGKTDVAVFRPSDGNWYIWFTETDQFAAAHFGTNGDKPVPADYDGDGKADIAVFRPSEGNWYYLRSTDFSYNVVHWGISTDKPVPADYDGDGKDDLTVYRDGDWYILRSLDNNYGIFHFGNATDLPMPFYVQNDHLAELMVHRPTNSFWYRYYYQAPPSAGVVFGLSGYTPIYFGLPNN